MVNAIALQLSDVELKRMEAAQIQESLRQQNEEMAQKIAFMEIKIGEQNESYKISTGDSIEANEIQINGLQIGRKDASTECEEGMLTMSEVISLLKETQKLFNVESQTSELESRISDLQTSVMESRQQMKIRMHFDDEMERWVQSLKTQFTDLEDFGLNAISEFESLRVQADEHARDMNELIAIFQGKTELDIDQKELEENRTPDESRNDAFASGYTQVLDMSSFRFEAGDILDTQLVLNETLGGICESDILSEATDSTIIKTADLVMSSDQDISLKMFNKVQMSDPEIKRSATSILSEPQELIDDEFITANHSEQSVNVSFLEDPAKVVELELPVSRTDFEKLLNELKEEDSSLSSHYSQTLPFQLKMDTPSLWARPVVVLGLIGFSITCFYYVILDGIATAPMISFEVLLEMVAGPLEIPI